MDRWGPAVALLAGGLLVVAPLAGLQVDQAAYRHDVRPVSADAVPAGASAVGFDDLSPSARTVVADALGTDGVAVERGDDPSLRPGVRVVVHGGDHYVVETNRRPPSTTDLWIEQSLETYGIVLLGVGAVALRTGRQSGPVAFALVGVVCAGAAVAGVRPVGGVGLLSVVLASQFVALWWAVGTAAGRVLPQPT
jgi:hypothetical protein